MEIVSSFFNGGELKPLATEELPQAFSYSSSDVVRNLILLGLLKTALTSQTLDRVFYGFWKDGNLQGVGLMGDIVTWAGGIEMAQALGERARDSRSCQPKLLVGLEHEVQVFMKASQDTRIGKTERHLLYALRRGELNISSAGGLALSPACREEWEELFQIHTDLYFELTGQPFSEPETSAQRLLRRIEDGKTWIACEDGKIIFKADISSDIGDAVLLEAIWTRPDLRGRGIGTESLGNLCSHLLTIYPLICLSFRKDQPRLKGFYERLGFKYHGDYILVRY